MTEILNYLLSHKTLEKEDARNVIRDIAAGAYNDQQVSVFLSVYMMRPVTVTELEGFREALLELCHSVDLSDYDPIDLCGTGGDGKSTFNISTTASFVAAGAGLKVAKHGNYGVSSISGSSNVMEFFGIRFTADEGILRRQLEEAGICFLHAPLFHPALKAVGPVRKAIGMKTFFNMLGPLVNPAMVQNQVVGVFNLELARVYAYLYQQTSRNYLILHALDGYDEVSLTGITKIIGRNREQLLSPGNFGLATLHPSEITGGRDVAAAGKIFHDILSGNGTLQQNQVVCANAALAVSAMQPELSLPEAYAIAEESLLSGRALKSFNRLIALQ